MAGMRRKFLAALCLLAFFQPTVSGRGHVADPRDGTLADTNIRYIGRWDKTDPHLYHSYWTGAYLRVGFTGTSIGIRLAEGTTLAVRIDGEPLRTVHAGSGTTPLVTEALKPGAHTLLVGGAGQNEEVAFQGLTLASGGATRPVAALPIVEFVGDSISAGVQGNYCALTADAMGVDRVQISFSGRALTSGYGCADEKTGLDTQYFRLKNFNHLTDNPQTPWDFSYTPQVIVVNLGQNDQCGSEPDATLTASCAQFARKIRARFPRAQIAFLRPFGGPYETPIRQAVATLSAAGDGRVRYLDTTGWLEKADFRDGVHPNDAGNLKVAQRLVPLLRPLLTDASKE